MDAVCVGPRVYVWDGGTVTEAVQLGVGVLLEVGVRLAMGVLEAVNETVGL